MIKIGFTGTQKGMSNYQLGQLDKYLQKLRGDISEAHHGDCVGADETFHQTIEYMIGYQNIWLHPPADDKKRAWCFAGHILPAKPYLVRNHDIVDAVDLMIAVPRHSHEELRSGTWATIRYAVNQSRPLYIIYPATG